MPVFSRRHLLAGGAASLATLPFAQSQHAAAAQADKPRNLLSSRYSEAEIQQVLIPVAQWRPFPRLTDRESWQAMRSDVRQQIVTRGERALETEWPLLPATLFLEYARTGNRTHYEHARDQRRNKLESLVLAECTENNARFLDEIANGIWLTCEETFWGVPAHLGMQKEGVGLADATEPIVDLFAAETSSLLSWTDYLLGSKLDSVSKLVRPRIQQEVQRRILKPGLTRNDFWWMGLNSGLSHRDKLNNWTPWICSNWLTSTLLLETDSEKRRQSVVKIMRILDLFVNGYPDDGGCDEGPSYWGRAGGSLFDCLELLYSATNGTVNLYGDRLIAEMGRYIYRAHIDNDYYMNFGDAPAKVHTPGNLVYRYGKRIHDSEMTEFGAYMAMQEDDGIGFESLGRTLPALFDLGELRAAPRTQALVRDVWLPDSQIMAARTQQGSAKGFYLGAKGGVNGRSHGHNDAGNFLIFVDGNPVIIDAGVESYTAKTFGPHRYDIWTMQSAYHNLPTIGGVMQKNGLNFRASGVAYKDGGDVAEIRMNIASAYPPEAGLRRWIRTLQLDRKTNRVRLRESFELQRAAPEIVLSLMTSRQARTDGEGRLRMPASGQGIPDVLLHYDAQRFMPKVETIEIQDDHLRSAWGDRIYRVLLTARQPRLQENWQFEFERS
jgi:hypothetical protein